jgi:hypothetical protein
MPTKTSAGPNEVVRLEVLRLVPPLALRAPELRHFFLHPHSLPPCTCTALGTGCWLWRQPLSFMSWCLSICCQDHQGRVGCTVELPPCPCFLLLAASAHFLISNSSSSSAGVRNDASTRANTGSAEWCIVVAIFAFVFRLTFGTMRAERQFKIFHNERLQASGSCAGLFLRAWCRAGEGYNWLA